MESEQTLISAIQSNNSRKRTHDQISTESTRVQPAWASNFSNTLSNNASSSASPYHQSTSFPSARYSGDGLDLRRPIMSQPATVNVIDLTDEPDSPYLSQSHSSNTASGTNSLRATRLPRFSRDVIDLEEEADDEPYVVDDDTQQAFDDAMGDLEYRGNEEDSPDVEFLWANTTQPERPPPPPPSLGVGHFLQPSLPGTDIHRRSTSARSSQPVSTSGGFFQSVRTLFGMRPDEVRGFDAEDRQRLQLPIPYQRRHPSVHFPHSARLQLYTDADTAGGLHGAFQTPGALDFETAAFHYHHETAVTSSLPTYTSPLPPRAGFTRSAVEEDIVVCPNCEEELGIGNDELKRQVWVIKKCGHVYCGECTAFRHKTKAKELRHSRTKPFSKCVVEGCGKLQVSGSRCMFQLFV